MSIFGAGFSSALTSWAVSVHLSTSSKFEKVFDGLLEHKGVSCQLTKAQKHGQDIAVELFQHTITEVPRLRD